MHEQLQPTVTNFMTRVSSTIGTEEGTKNDVNSVTKNSPGEEWEGDTFVWFRQWHLKRSEEIKDSPVNPILYSWELIQKPVNI